MEPGLIIVGLIAVSAIVIVSKGIRIVQQAQTMIDRKSVV